MTLSQYIESNSEQGRKARNSSHPESDLVMEKELINRFVNKLKLPFISIEDNANTGEVCFANCPELRPEFRSSFNIKDILDYVYAVLYSTQHYPSFSLYLKMDFKTIPIPTDEAIFWKLVSLGNELRNIQMEVDSLGEKLERRRGEIIKEIDEIFFLFSALFKNVL